MDKKLLRKEISQKKRAMTPAQIEEKSAALARQFLACEAYRQAKTIYGYMPYNQEVRTVPILAQALKDGKQVAVPKVYGDTMRFILLEDLTAVEKSDMGIPEPIADAPIANDPHALVLMPGLSPAMVNLLALVDLTVLSLSFLGYVQAYFGTDRYLNNIE